MVSEAVEVRHVAVSFLLRCEYPQLAVVLGLYRVAHHESCSHLSKGSPVIPQHGSHDSDKPGLPSAPRQTPTLSSETTCLLQRAPPRGSR